MTRTTTSKQTMAAALIAMTLCVAGLAIDETQELLQAVLNNPKLAADPEFKRILDDPNVYVAISNGDGFTFLDLGGNRKPRRSRTRMQQISLSSISPDSAVSVQLQ